jgi:hypothetical protein
MEANRKSALVDAWIKLQSQPAGSGSADALMWASIELDSLCMDAPEQCWEIILSILAKTDDEWVLTNLAAGPVESLVASHGDVVISWLEREAARSPAFRELLGGVWQNLISDDVWQRIQRVR